MTLTPRQVFTFLVFLACRYRRPWASLGCLALILSGGCGGEPSTSAKKKRPAEQKLSVQDLGKKRSVTLAALKMPYRKVAAALGAHKVSCSSTLENTVGKVKKKVEQKLDLRRDRQGQYAAVKTTSRQYGSEVIWVGGWLYPRLRYSKFIRRRPRRGEPDKILDRMAGYLPAYVRLLERYLELKPAGVGKHQGRAVIKLRFGVLKTPLKPRSGGAPAKSWRRTVMVKQVTGQAWLDAETGAPLKVSMKAGWTFNPPAGVIPRSGIPTRISTGDVGRTALTFEYEVSAIGPVDPIAPPPAEETNLEHHRRRLEIERQMLVGERSTTGHVKDSKADGANISKSKKPSVKKPSVKAPKAKDPKAKDPKAKDPKAKDPKAKDPKVGKPGSGTKP